MAAASCRGPVLRQRFSFRRTTRGRRGGAPRGDCGRPRRRSDAAHPPRDGGALRGPIRAPQLPGRQAMAKGVAGETVVVPAGVRHALPQQGSRPLTSSAKRGPRRRCRSSSKRPRRSSRAGKITRHALPKRPSVLLEAAVMAEHHRDMVVLLFPPMPPPFLRRVTEPFPARATRRASRLQGWATAQGS